MTLDVKIKLDPRVELKARRTIDGNIMILDHEDIDIVLMVEKGKCVTFPKNEMSDRVYASQDRMFRFLTKKGLIKQSTIQGSNVFGSMEAEMLEVKIPGIDREQAFLYSIFEYLKVEKPYFRINNEYEEDRLDALLTPDDENSTDLGDVPQSDRKGSQHKQIGPYGFQYNYSLVREGKESEDT